MTNLRNLLRITDSDTAARILDMIDGRADPCKVSPACAAWVRQCLHPPEWDEQVLCAADELLGTYGVEGVADVDGLDGVSYCNTGDTYEDTLFLDHGRFRVSSLGTMVERVGGLNQGH